MDSSSPQGYQLLSILLQAIENRVVRRFFHCCHCSDLRLRDDVVLVGGRGGPAELNAQTGSRCRLAADSGRCPESSQVRHVTAAGVERVKQRMSSGGDPAP
jgi:hypothetical protein